MAPEMIKGNEKCSNNHGYGKEVDIWAIGVMSYIIMSGEFPFFDTTDEDVMARIVRDGINFDNEWRTKTDLGKSLHYAADVSQRFFKKVVGEGRLYSTDCNSGHFSPLYRMRYP